MPRKTRDNKPKVRRRWTRKPETQVQPNRRQYDRNQTQQTYPEELNEIDLSEGYEMPPQTSHGRILGIDFGERRVGLAVSDPTGRIAQGLDTLETDSPTETLVALEELVVRYEVRRIVVGLPMNMDGTEGDITASVRKFVENIEDRVGCDVITWDERLTSAAAQRAMADMGRTVKGRKSEIDRIAATIILQGYLDSVR